MELWQEILLKTAYALGMISVVMGIAAYSVLAERKVSSWIQGRVGPNRTTLPIIGAIPFIVPQFTFPRIPTVGSDAPCDAPNACQMKHQMDY